MKKKQAGKSGQAAGKSRNQVQSGGKPKSTRSDFKREEKPVQSGARRDGVRAQGGVKQGAKSAQTFAKRDGVQTYDSVKRDARASQSSVKSDSRQVQSSVNRDARASQSSVKGDSRQSQSGMKRDSKQRKSNVMRDTSLAQGSVKHEAASARGGNPARNTSSHKTDGRSGTVEQTTSSNRGEQVELDIIGLTHDGEGVGRSNGFTLFVQGALPGEKVKARVMRTKKQYGYARLETILQESPDRLQPPCAIYDECGGCQLQHLDYAAQLEWKRQHVVDNLRRIGKLQIEGEEQTDQETAGAASGQPHGGVKVMPTIGMDEPWRYRNKAAVPVGAAELDGGLIAGFYERGSHRIIDMDDCLIQHGENDEIIRVVKRIARELRIKPYDEETGEGVLRHVMARVGVVTGEKMVVLVTNGSRLPRQPEWIEHLRAALPGLKSIVHNVNERNTNVIFGDETKVVWGKEVIYDELDGIRFAISARSFYQVNPTQTVSLYRKALEYAALTGTENVIDAYCGIGTISLFLARAAGRVYGVEIVPEAIEDAKRNAEINDIDNAEFEAGPAEVVIPRWRKEGIQADVIVVDPPRKGCDPELLDTILKIRPERVVYVSCNPSTLARDLRILEDGGYRAVEVTPVDMFPMTSHVEVVIGMQRKDT